MRIAVIGAGAVGGYFGARLATAGEEVTFIARGETLEALRARGLRVDSPKGDVVLPKVEAKETPAEVGPVDTVLVAVKAWQVLEVAEAIRPLIGDRTVVVPLQNGVEAPDQLAAVHGKERVIGGTCAIVAVKLVPGHIKHVTVEPLIAVGELDRRPSRRVASLVETFRKAGIAARERADIRVSIWKKFLFIAPVSGVGAVARVPLGVVRDVPETRELVVRAMEEVRSVAAAEGVELSPEDMDRTMSSLDSMPPDATTSMQRDVMEGRPSELESINGAVVRIGRARGVDTPVNQFIYASLLPLETRARERS